MRRDGATPPCKTHGTLHSDVGARDVVERLARYACFLHVLVSCAHAWASSPATAYLKWQAPAASGCIDRRELEGRVEALLARDVFEPRASADNVVDGTVAYRDRRWVANLRLVARDGQALGARELSTEEADCAALNGALVVVLATLIDSPAVVQPGAWQGFGVGMAVGVDTAVLPAAAAGASVLSVFAPARPWPAFWLELLGWLPQSRRDSSARGGRFQAVAASLSVCPTLFERRAVHVAACGGARMGLLQARGLGLDLAHTPGRLLAAAFLEPSVSWRLFEHLSLRLSVGVSLALERPEFYLFAADGARHPIYRPELFGMFARVGFIVERF
jgi:hypothetical protein